MFGQPYRDYTNALKIDYPDMFGCLGGFLFGFFFAWVLLPSSTNKPVLNRPFQERTLFFTGLIFCLILFFLLLALLMSSDPKEYWSRP